jgi:hypothetical protein
MKRLSPLLSLQGCQVKLRLEDHISLVAVPIMSYNVHTGLGQARGMLLPTVLSPNYGHNPEFLIN